MAEPSIFSRIVAGEIPATVVAENERIMAIKDIAPKAPIHFVVFPKEERYANVAELASADPALLAELVATASTLADDHSDGSYRLVFNTGAGAGQTIFHVHAHVLSGGLEEDSLGGA